jgi:GNAT superfamily N-acetyltransferase
METVSDQIFPDKSIRCFQFDGAPSEIARVVEEFRRRLFPLLGERYVHDRIDFATNPELFVAESEGRFVAFKIGYQTTATTFFSWLGGVDEDFRRGGLATRLAALQHDRCLELGVRAIETRTRAENRAMLIVNLRAGFQIVGVEADAYGRFVVLQRKDLD